MLNSHLESDNSYATESIINGGDITSAQLMMGHSDSRQTQCYVVLAKANIKKMQAQYSPVENIRKKGFK